MQENAVSKASRAKVFLKFLQLGWPSINYWTWEFLFNVPLMKIYPTILRKVGLAPTTVILYVGQAISFIEFFRSTPPKHSRVTSGQTSLVTRELRKLHRDMGRTVLGHQTLVKQGKGQKLVPREDLARCQALARAKIPSLLEDIEKAPPRDPKTRYRFFGYLAAYFSSIYGHRTGVLTQMRVKEVREAIGDDETGYLINVMEHKTVRKFGTAQIYLEAEEGPLGENGNPDQNPRSKSKFKAAPKRKPQSDTPTYQFKMAPKRTPRSETKKRLCHLVAVFGSTGPQNESRKISLSVLGQDKVTVCILAELHYSPHFGVAAPHPATFSFL
ncbi:hypothetical protein D5F01_LYC23777 [Larimichthys crocea]|uniref:Uncharacterized protein n=1 Tax=Larimichthys crocea TaxID=215358 RepID=A0A6G0HGG8_LARCR|nr:hypothetical protein D5F01_LYC23777 [Larimichthys crocea]